MKRQSVEKFGIAVLCSIVALLLSSCVYYNTFYNAKNYFKSAQAQPLRDNDKPAAKAIQDYDKAIDRCVYILREHQSSKWADDALFLMAKSLYYKKLNLVQARERFTDLIRIFPNSEFIPESNLYIARIDYELNKKDDAHRRLNELLANPSLSKLHPEIHLLKSKYYSDEHDYQRSRQHLQTIIDQYPNSKEFEHAYYELGKNYLDNELYEESINVFEKFLKTRSTRRGKINARYQIARNYYFTGQYLKSLQILNKLLKDEYEIKEIPKLSILKARVLIEMGNITEAEELFLSVILNNPKSEMSAEACYYLAEMYFLKAHKYEDAIEYYNKIQAEYRNSTFVQAGVSRSAVVSQIVQFSKTDRTISTSELIDEQLKLAEYYLYVMNLPDSALSVYANIPVQEKALKEKRDEMLESAATGISTASTDSEIDSTEVSNNALPGKDMPGAEPNKFDLAKLEEDLTMYAEKFTPYAQFASAWVWLNIKKDENKAKEVLEQLSQTHPQNRYTYATKAMINGEKIVFSTEEELDFENRYEKAIDLADKNPKESYDSLKLLLGQLNEVGSDSTRTMPTLLSEMKKKTTFSLGYVSYFLLSDSTQAKPYLKTLLEDNKSSEYSLFINKFFNGEHFIITDGVVKEPIIDAPEEEPIPEEKLFSSEPPSIEQKIEPPLLEPEIEDGDYPLEEEIHYPPPPDPFIEEESVPVFEEILDSPTTEPVNDLESSPREEEIEDESEKEWDPDPLGILED